MTPRLLVSDEVNDALAGRKPVVALESTIISHGMPYPQNVETALAVEAVVRAEGAIPATIAVIDGWLRVGLDGADMERLGNDRDVVKASGRDLAAVMLRGGTAGTTVAATMRIAHLAGLKVFATGGIGGVHRGAEETFDISADLTELGSTSVAVVCAGVKSILDIPKTVEVLETLRIPVFAYRSDDFPAFFTRSSGLRADHRCDTAAELAHAIALHHSLKSGTGFLVVNPVPEASEIDPSRIEDAISRALAEVRDRGITRKNITPFLLGRITELTGGNSLAANIA